MCRENIYHHPEESLAIMHDTEQLFAIQKAFVNGIPGCVEHQLKLATAIHDARTKHRSLTVCWLDLANAYGSVHHKLIRFSLQHYHAPDKLTNTITNIYNNLRAEITA